jgi:hypothetical protein
MSIGSSGRIVIEVAPDVKRQLYSALAREGITLKKWFLREAHGYMEAATPASSELNSDGESRLPEQNTR